MDGSNYGVSPMTSLTIDLEGANISSLKKKLSFSQSLLSVEEWGRGSCSSKDIAPTVASMSHPSQHHVLFQSGLRVSTPPGRCGRRFILDENSPVLRSPSGYTVVVRQRNLLHEDSDASSQDSAFSEGSFRFLEPSGFAPKRTESSPRRCLLESPRRCLKFSCENLYALSTASSDSGCSSEDGFAELTSPDEDSNSLLSTTLGTLLNANIQTPVRSRKRRSSPHTSGSKRVKPLGDRASEENKGTLFQYGFTKKAKQDQPASESDLHIKMALQRSTQEELIGDFSRTFTLPLMPGKHRDLKSISSETLAKLINGDYSDSVASYKIVDCRYPYEYEGGHIKGAVNLYTCDHILKDLLEPKNLEEKKEHSEKSNILIFHCEFSSERGPFLSRFLRQKDRAGHEYPNLAFPELYLLHGGYKAFFAEHKELCEPQSYKTMQDPAHNSEFKHFMAKSKSWAPSSHKKLTMRSLSRLGF